MRNIQFKKKKKYLRMHGMKKSRNKDENTFTAGKIPRNISLLHGFIHMYNFSDV